jgi:hypothetical protein
VKDEARARELAWQRLNASENYISVEVCRDGAPLFTVCRKPSAEGEIASDWPPASITDRALELARTGEHATVDEIRARLEKEGFVDAPAMMAGSPLLRQVRKLIKAARTLTPPDDPE